MACTLFVLPEYSGELIVTQEVKMWK